MRKEKWIVRNSRIILAVIIYTVFFGIIGWVIIQEMTNIQDNSVSIGQRYELTHYDCIYTNFRNATLQVTPTREECDDAHIHNILWEEPDHDNIYLNCIKESEKGEKWVFYENHYSDTVCVPKYKYVNYTIYESNTDSITNQISAIIPDFNMKYLPFVFIGFVFGMIIGFLLGRECFKKR